jgi:hypothetical protein
MNNILDIDQLIVDLENARNTYIENGSEILVNYIKSIMLEYPEVKSIYWNQYAPYFNDGEACTFSVNDYSLKINGYDSDNYNKDNIDESLVNVFTNSEKRMYQKREDGTSIYNLPQIDNVNYNERHADIIIAVNKIFSIPEEIFESLYGDGTEMTATIDGIEVNEYDDHD